MQIIIPMAGMGKRFKRAGYTDPKPLITIDGKPIIEHIVGMFPGAERFIFICNHTHLETTSMRNILQTIRPDAEIASVTYEGLGPVHSTAQVKEYIRDDMPTLVCYCDVHVYWDFEHFKKHVKETNADAALIGFTGFHPPLLQEGLYATTRTTDDNQLIEVREKHSFTPDKMDSWTSAGMHYFKNGGLVKKYFDKLIQRNIRCNDEYYVSLIHNLLIEDGLKNILYPIDYFISWGKPEDVREYEYWSKHFNT